MAEDLYVRPGMTSGARTGADWNNAWSGLADVKWGTGAGRLGAGDTLWIAGGNYTSSLVIGASGAAGSPITIKRVRATDATPVAASGWSSSFDAQVVLNGGAMIYFDGGIGSHVTVDGQMKSGIKINYPNGGSGVEIAGGVNFTDITLRYIEAAGPGPITQISDTRGFDLTTSAMLTNLTLSYCEAHHSDTLLQVTQSTNLVIEYCDFHHAGAVNAATYHPNTIYLSTAKNATIRYNILREIDVEGLFFGDPGNDGVRIYGNLFYQGSSSPNSGRGIEFDNSADSRNVLVYNNTFVGLPLPGVNFNNGKPHPGAVVRNNLFFNCSANYGPAAHDYNWYSGSNYGEPNGVANGTAPFVNAAAYDYRIVGTLATNKPRDRGINLGAPYDVDRDGNLRGADGAWDMGAYEYPSGGQPVNTAPTIAAIASQTMTTGSTLGPIPVSIADAETAAANLVLTGSSGNTALLPNANIVLGGSGGSRTVTLTPVAGQTGSATVTLSVSDGSAVATTSFALTVLSGGGNTAPTISAIANQTVTTGGTVGPIAFTIGDAETAAGSLVVSGVSSNPALVAASGLTLGGSGASRSVTLTPVAGATGTATITLTVSDGTATASRSFVLTVTAPVPPPPAGSGLVAAYSFDEGAGTVAGDASGNGNVGTLQNATWTTGGRHGSALSFNGASSMVVVPSSASLQFGTAMTLEAWTNPTVAQSGWRTIVQKQVDAYFLHASGSGALRPAGGGTFGGALSWTSAPAAIATGSWTHLAVTYDGAAVRLYVNGTLVASQAQTGAIEMNDSALRIGGNVPYGEYFQGFIDEVRVYNRALSAAEIQTDMTTPIRSAAPVNTPPTISTLAGVTVANGAVVGPLAFTVGDAETAAGSLTVTGSSSNLALVPDANIALGGSGASRTVTLTPLAGASGTTTITLEVSDGSATARSTFTVTVSAPVNTVPTISPIAGRTIVAGSSTGPIAFTVRDAETAATALTVTAGSDNPNLVPAAALVLGGSGANRTIEVTPAAEAGSARITVRVSDGALTASTEFVLVVDGPPTISAIADQTTLAGVGVGPIPFTVSDGETLAEALTVAAASSNPTLVPVANITFGGSGASRTLTVMPAANQTGSSVLTVTVSDGRSSAAASFGLTVTAPPNAAPTLAVPGGQSTVEGVPVGPLAFTVADLETAAGSLVVTGRSSNPTLVPDSNIVLGGSGGTRTVTVTPVAGMTGLTTVTLTVSDGSAATSASFPVTVTAASRRGLVAAYAFNEGTGGLATDASGNGHTGTLRGATWTTAGKFGGALSFNGSSLVAVAPTTALNLGNAMTLEAWVQPTVSQTGWRTIVQKQVDSYFLHASSRSGLRPAGGGTFGGRKAFATSGSAIAVGRWTHLAVTYDGTMVRLYVDGVQVASRSQTGAIESNNNGLRIGGNDVYGEYFRGLIDEVRVYNRALSAAELAADMQAPVVSEWSQADVGAVGLTGAGSADPVAATITVQGAGAGIGGTADAFRYVFRPLRGDGVVEARVELLAGAGAAARAGVMIRESLEAGARNVFVGVGPGGLAAAQARAATGGETGITSGPGEARAWVRLVRTGTTIVAAVSADGVAWTTVATYPVTMGSAVLAGWAVTSGSTAQLATAVFGEPFIQ